MAENKGYRSYDLSSSTKWKSLSTGEHTVYIVAKATDYADSVKSATLTFTKLKQYTINNVLTYVTADTNNVTTIEEGSTATLKYTANTGYKLPDTITVTGATHTWNKSTGTVTLSNPTANVSIAITGVVDTVMISGKYTFADTLTAPTTAMSEDVTFSASLNNFTGQCTNISLMPSTGVMNFTQSTGDTVLVYNFTTNTWSDLPSKTIDFGATPISISSAFYTWLEANAHQTKTYNITNTLTNVTANANNVTTIEENSSAILRFTADTGYTLPDSITVTGATYTWDKTAGTVSINNPTADVNITIVGTKPSAEYVQTGSTVRITNATHKQTGGTLRLS